MLSLFAAFLPRAGLERLAGGRGLSLDANDHLSGGVQGLSGVEASLSMLVTAEASLFRPNSFEFPS